MPLYSAEALILRTYKLAEADRIVVFLTKDRGKKRGVARGARRSRSRFAGALEPFTRVNVSYFEKETRELVSLDYAEPLRSPMSATDPDALGYVGYLAELLDGAAQDADPNERLFRLGVSVLEALATGTPIVPLVRYFEYWVLRLQGVYPPWRACERCGASLAQDGAWLVRSHGGFTCRRCGGRERADLSPDALAFLAAASELPPDALASVPMPSPAGREIAAVHRALISAHLEREPRSTRVLRELGA
jgi:DNA repair protein RecO (recombination protein O)